MSKLSEKDVRHIVSLARLNLSNKDLEKFKDQLSCVITYFEELNEVNTENVEPTSQTTGLENVVREDEIKVEECLNQKEALSGTDEEHKGYFSVPAIFEERT